MNTDGGESSRRTWFLGEFEYAVDAQRRVAIPRTWRGAAPDEARFFVLPGREKSLQIVPGPMFQGILAHLANVSFADGPAALALASVGSLAQECLCDAQGRISLTPALMAHAGIEPRGTVILIGALITIQIWHPDVWRARRMDSNAGMDVIQALQQKSGDITTILEKWG